MADLLRGIFPRLVSSATQNRSKVASGLNRPSSISKGAFPMKRARPYLSLLTRWFSLFALALISHVVPIATSPVYAQNIQFTQGSVGSGLDNTVQIPIIGYPGRGASLPVTLYYSSRVWRIGHLGTVNNGNYQTIAEAIYAQYSISGWKTSLDLPTVEWPKEDDQYYYSGQTFCF